MKLSIILILFIISVNPAISLARSSAINNNIGWPGTDLQGMSCRNLGVEVKELRDYKNPLWHQKQINQGNNYLHLVEKAHFTSNVRFLQHRNRGTGSIHSDISYALKKFPNHYPALYSMSLYFLWKKYKDDFGPKTSQHSGVGLMRPECFFYRAISFTKEDPKLHLLFGIYLRKSGKLNLALEEFKKSEAIAPDNPSLISELAQLYFDKGEYQTSALYVGKAPKDRKRTKNLIKKLSDKNISIKLTNTP